MLFSYGNFKSAFLWRILVFMSVFKHIFGFVSLNKFVGLQPRDWSIWGRRESTLFPFLWWYFRLASMQDAIKLPNLNSSGGFFSIILLPESIAKERAWLPNDSSVTTTFRCFWKGLMTLSSVILSLMLFAQAAFIYK